MINKKLILTLSIAVSLPTFALEPRPTPNPNVGLDGAATMHSDTYSSDTTPLAGPWGADSNRVKSKSISLAAACPTSLIRSDGHPLVLCTNMFGLNPVVHILNKKSGLSMAKLNLPAGSLLGGVYAYLDNQDRLVMVDGKHNLVRVKAYWDTSRIIKRWKVSIDESVSLTEAVNTHCTNDGESYLESNCDSVVSINAGGLNDVWFVTKQGLVGSYDTETAVIKTLKLAAGEEVHNSFSNTLTGQAGIATNEALYLIALDEEGELNIQWRAKYDSGSHRKPGQLSKGTGATPTFFGPETGSEYLMITDNNDFQTSLLVYKTDVDQAELICKYPLFEEGTSGTENSAIGIGRSVIVASTYGYPYPKVPDGVPAAVPEKANFSGGMIRIDLYDDESGCSEVWQNDLRSSAVPKLSTADNMIYTVERRNVMNSPKATLVDSFYFTALNPDTGITLYQKYIGGGFFSDTLQMAGNIGPDQVYWQGTVGGMIRISPR
ncbi:MAG: hypothetical protein JKY50_01970 [Oleispira sp.]|nr:hypothetical protein [Oleispira sp.]MBL4879862.1 hypothetical protein [Oleispira sp.]